MTTYTNQPAHIQRRVSFLLNEVKNSSPRDQAITYIMRVLSNHASVGFDGSSHLIKKRNCKVSQAAFTALKNSSSFEEWSKNTINEHPVPLKYTWEWIAQNSVSLSEEIIWNHFVSNPMVTILRCEDKALNAAGLRAASDFARYEKVGINVITLDRCPELIYSTI
jgi:hypothetical protein